MSNNDATYESSVLFWVANFQYLVTCLSFSIAKPFRKPFYTNVPFAICVVVLVIFNALCIYLPSDNGLLTFFNIADFSYKYRYWVGLGIVVNSIITYVAEKLIV